MPVVAKTNRHQESPRKARRYNKQRSLNAIASSISSDIFNKQESLSVDRFGRVDIHSSHPDYKYWTEDE